MRREQKWVYYCDHCAKSGRSASHMKKHEMHCTKNPKRECRMCKCVNNKQPEMETMLCVIGTAEQMADNETNMLRFDINVTPIRDITHNCPACILAALRQYEGGKRHFNGFDFKKEAKEWLDDFYSACSATKSPSLCFGKDHWSALRAKRTFENIGLVPKPHPDGCTCKSCECPF